jgi:hypothetical protein
MSEGKAEAVLKQLLKTLKANFSSGLDDRTTGGKSSRKSFQSRNSMEAA